jgi:hypothetical protein
MKFAVGSRSGRDFCEHLAHKAPDDDVLLTVSRKYDLDEEEELVRRNLPDLLC